MKLAPARLRAHIETEKSLPIRTILGNRPPPRGVLFALVTYPATIALIGARDEDHDPTTPAVRKLRSCLLNAVRASATSSSPGYALTSKRCQPSASEPMKSTPTGSRPSFSEMTRARGTSVGCAADGISVTVAWTFLRQSADSYLRTHAVPLTIRTRTDSPRRNGSMMPPTSGS